MGQLAHTSEPKSSAGRRTMTMPQPLMAMTAEHRARKDPTGADADALAFTSASGDPLRYTNGRRRVWVPATEKVGLNRPRLSRSAAGECHRARRRDE